MDCIVINTRTNDFRSIEMTEWTSVGNQISLTLEQVADKLIKRISYKYPKAHKLIRNADKHISIIDGTCTKCIFELRLSEQLTDYDDTFLS